VTGVVKLVSPGSMMDIVYSESDAMIIFRSEDGRPETIFLGVHQVDWVARAEQIVWGKFE
jgi:hypothetical protein